MHNKTTQKLVVSSAVVQTVHTVGCYEIVPCDGTAVLVVYMTVSRDVNKATGSKAKASSSCFIIFSLLKNHMSDARAYIIRTSQMKHTELY